MTIKKAALLFNPSSGKGRSLSRQTHIEQTLTRGGIPFDLTVTRGEAHLRELAARSALTYSTIIAVGGDTTFNIAATEILKAFPPGSRSQTDAPALGLIGTGSANDILRDLGILKIHDACEAIRRAETRWLDAGAVWINQSPDPLYFLGSLSLGLGTAVNRHVERFFQQHPRLARFQPASQVYAGVRGVSSAFKKGETPLPIRVRIDGNDAGDAEKVYSCSLLVILNTPFYAGGLRLNPAVTDNDGRLDLCLTEKTGLGGVFRAALPILLSRNRRGKSWTFFQNRQFILSHALDQPFDIQMDGEMIPQIRRARVAAVSPGLRVFHLPRS